MGDQQQQRSKSQSQDHRNKVSIKHIRKTYKNLVNRWSTRDKHSSNKHIESSPTSKEGEDSPGRSGSFYPQSRHERKQSKDDLEAVLSRSSSSLLSRFGSRRSRTPAPAMERSASRRSKSVTSQSRSTRTTPSETLSKVMSQGPLGRSTSTSGRSTTPIVFTHSSSAARKKPLPVEKQLECTLEELCFGAVKKIKITRNVITEAGMIVQKEETLKVEVKPGWRRGTKITFEGKGDEKPGYLPADIVFLIEEKKHRTFKRVGDALELGVEVPLVKAITGCSITVPLLGGEKMTVAINDVIHPGFEKSIAGQGMPLLQGNGKRGELVLKFLVRFPRHLGAKQRSEIRAVLQVSLPMDES